MLMPSAAAAVPNVLVVDDVPANLRLLVGMLKEVGYRARVAPNGILALQAARNEPPDLILLDINMPEMNGYEVCERLKADEKLKEIPVIYISALNETLDKVKAFEAGGVDFVTKPFQFEEVVARIRTHLELRRQKRELQESYARLQELETLRDNLTHMIVHDMRAPLTAILGTLDIIVREPVSKMDPQLAELARMAGLETKNLTEMVTQLLDISRLESGQMPMNIKEGDLVQTARAALDTLIPMAENRRLTIASEEPVIVAHDADVVRRVITNLVGNAFKFTRPNGEVKIVVSREERGVRVAVVDNGDGIPAKYHQKIFEKFGQAEGE
ncbi:MAG: response regulator, partial [Elusimicrobia bacterium]|nr:response regulator [Elusimicrobiota bacterium]